MARYRSDVQQIAARLSLLDKIERLIDQVRQGAPARRGAKRLGRRRGRRPGRKTNAERAAIAAAEAAAAGGTTQPAATPARKEPVKRGRRRRKAVNGAARQTGKLASVPDVVA